MNFHSLNSRIVAFFSVLLLAILLLAYAFIDASITRNARETTRVDLVTGERILKRLLDQRGQQLVHAASVLTADFGFRQAVATEDSETIALVLRNHGARISADVMMLVGLDHRLIADKEDDRARGRQFEYIQLLTTAEGEGRAAAIAVVGGRAVQLVVLPILGPQPLAWIVMGFVIGDGIAADMKSLTQQDVSLVGVAPRNGNLSLLATSLPTGLKAPLVDELARSNLHTHRSTLSMFLDGEEFETVLAPVPSVGEGGIVAVLQHSLREALAPFDRLRAALVALTLASLVAAIVGSVLIARNIARPVSMLAKVARHIGRGDYTQSVEVARNDEIGDLAVAFNRMREGIAAREEKIADLAYTDGLTGLPNRTLFGDRLQQAISASTRTRMPLSVLFIDLDRFKYVNDTLGHPVGDLLLRQVGVRLREALPRQSDTLARLGGDEFAILLPTDDQKGATTVALRLLDTLKEPILLEGHPVDVGGSIGIACSPDHGGDAATLMRRSDMAMYMAKQSGSGFAVFHPDFDGQCENRLSLMSELRQAVERNELTLVYQPKVTLGSGSTHAAEVLVRWQHPQRGFVPPDHFIPFAEQTGYIRAVTRWVLDEALRQCAAWRARGLSIELAVNISTRDLHDPELVPAISKMLEQHAASPKWLSLEITESAIMDDPEKALQTVELLHAMGFRLSIDDFGTGYSSLGYLKRLPVDELKIDRSFVKEMANDTDDATIVRSTVELAHNMALKVVAEGVEDRASYDLLVALGCDYAQGYFMGKPQSAEQFERWLAQSPWGLTGDTRDTSAPMNVVLLPKQSSTRDADLTDALRKTG